MIRGWNALSASTVLASATIVTGMPTESPEACHVIPRKWELYAIRDVGPDDVMIFAKDDETQPIADLDATDLDEPRPRVHRPALLAAADSDLHHS